MAAIYMERVTNLRIGMFLYMGKHQKPVRIDRMKECGGGRKGVGRTHVNERMCFDNGGYVEIYVPAKAAEAAKTIHESGKEKEDHGYRSWSPEERAEYDAMYDR